MHPRKTLTSRLRCAVSNRLRRVRQIGLTEDERGSAPLEFIVVGLLLLVQPVCAFLLDILVLQRDTLPREWLGLAFTLAGIFLASLKGRTRNPVRPA